MTNRCQSPSSWLLGPSRNFGTGYWQAGMLLGQSQTPMVGWNTRPGRHDSGKPVPWEQWQNSLLQEEEGKFPSEVQATPVHPSEDPSVVLGISEGAAEDVGGDGSGDVGGAEQLPTPPPQSPSARHSASVILTQSSMR